MIESFLLLLAQLGLIPHPKPPPPAPIPTRAAQAPEKTTSPPPAPALPEVPPAPAAPPTASYAVKPPYTQNERKYLPVLREEIEKFWPDVPKRAHFGAQVRQETCYSLTHSKCWSPYAELKTSREYGFGLGQLTKTERFDNFTEARKLHPSLKDWTWENRYNANYQLRTMVLMVRFNFNKFIWASDDHERLAFSFAAYNGGVGGVLSDRTICRTHDSCDHSAWFGHVERHSKKAKTAAAGYGKSFFEINREYVRNIMIVYPPRYRPYFGETNDR